MRTIKPCPKCGEIGGETVRYREEGYGYEYREFLLVTCKTCGYQRREPCADAKPTLPEGV